MRVDFMSSPSTGYRCIGSFCILCKRTIEIIGLLYIRLHYAALLCIVYIQYKVWMFLHGKRTVTWEVYSGTDFAKSLSDMKGILTPDSGEGLTAQRVNHWTIWHYSCSRTSCYRWNYSPFEKTVPKYPKVEEEFHFPYKYHSVWYEVRLHTTFNLRMLCTFYLCLLCLYTTSIAYWRIYLLIYLLACLLT